MADVHANAPLDYAPREFGRKWPIKQILLIAGAVLLLGIGVCAVGIDQALNNVAKIHTASNLRQVGQVIHVYAAE